MDTLWKIGLGFITGTLLACFSIRVPYWPGHFSKTNSAEASLSNVEITCWSDDRITLAALAFERLGILKR